MSHPLPVSNVFRDDEVRESLTADEALAARSGERAAAVPGSEDPRGRAVTDHDPRDGRGAVAPAGCPGGHVGRADPGAPGPDRRRRHRDPRLPPRRRRGRAGDGPRHRRPSFRRRGAAPAGRRSDRGQGRHHHQGHAHHCGLAHPRGLGAAVRRHRHATPQGGRPAHPRQDQHGRVRDGLVHRALRLRPDAQPMGHRPHPRRLRRRLGGCGRRVRGPARDRHRHRRLDPPARRDDRHRRRQADLRRRLALRARSRSPAASTRPARSPVRCSTPPCCTRSSPATTRWTRPASTHPVPAVVAAARRADVKGLRIGVVTELGGEGFQPGRRSRVQRGARAARGRRCRDRRGLLPELRLRPRRVLPDPAERGAQQPRPVRRDALRPARRARRRRRPERRAGHGGQPRRGLRRRGQAPHHPRAPTRCPAATTTPTTARRRRSAR